MSELDTAQIRSCLMKIEGLAKIQFEASNERSGWRIYLPPQCTAVWPEDEVRMIVDALNAAIKPELDKRRAAYTELIRSLIADKPEGI